MIRTMISAFGLAIVLGLTVGGTPTTVAIGKTLAIEDGMQVTMEYTLTLPDNTVADTTENQEPLTYVHGTHQVIPGLENALLGMKPGDKKQIVIPADKAYGPYEEKNKITVPRDKVPENVKVGALLRSREYSQPVKVIEVNDKNVVIDTNHPLAGKDLRFDVKIINVKPAPKEAGDSKTH